MQMITHEILKNYCISFSFLYFFAFLQRFIHQARLCATEIVVYMQRMIKMSFFRIANERCESFGKKWNEECFMQTF